MNTWTDPSGNAWNVSLSPSGLGWVFGKDRIQGHLPTTWSHAINLTVPGVSTYQGGMTDERFFLRAALRGPDGTSDLAWVDILTGDVEPIQILPPCGMFRAGPGKHWAATCGNGHGYDLWIDGRIVCADAGRPVAVSRTPAGLSAVLVAVAGATENSIALRLYIDGVKTAEFPAKNFPDTIDYFSFQYPFAGYGLGKPRWLNVFTGADLDVGVFPAHGESYPVAAGLLIWTVGQANGKTYVCGRLPFEGASWGVVVEVPGASTLDAAKLSDGTYRVAVNDRGALTVYDIPGDHPITKVPVEVVVTPPVDPAPGPGPDPVVPPIGRHVPVGFFFRDTYTDQRLLNGQIDQKGPDCPGSLTWCCSGEARAASTADKDSFTDNPIQLVIDESCVRTMALGPERWAQVFAVYLAPEEAANPLAAMEKQRNDVRATMARLGVPPKPFILYNAENPPVSLAAPDTIIAVQLYLRGVQGPADLLALAAQQREIVGTRRTAMICQAYGRWAGRTAETATYTGDLAKLVSVYADILRDWPEVVAVGWFSWRRPGGVLDYPELKPLMRAFARACQ